MLGGNFDAFFEQKLISNCDIKIYEFSNSNLLLTGADISDFLMERENVCVPSELPYDKVSFKLLDWAGLSSSVKEKLKKSEVIYIKFVVENVETTRSIRLHITKCKVDFFGVTAEIEAQGYLNVATSPSWLVLNKVTSNEAHISPYYASVAETYQKFYLSQGMSVMIAQNSDVAGKYIDNYSINVSFDFDNITDGLDEYEDENDRTDVVALGYPYGTEELLCEVDGGLGSASYEFDEQVVITKVQWRFTNPPTNWYDATWNDTTQYAGGWDLMARRANAWRHTGSELFPYDFRFYGFKTSKYFGDNQHVIFCDFLFDNDTSALANIQAIARDYYSKDYVEFNCRFDPRIEPLDVVYVNNIGAIKVEYISVTYNGGFSGMVRGRKVSDEITVEPLTVNFPNDEVASYFTLTNPNDFAVIAKVYTTDGHLTEIEVSANSTATIDVYGGSTYPYIYADAVKIDIGELNEDTYITVRSKDVYSAKNDTKVVLYKSVKQPVILRNEVWADDFILDIKNPNDVAVTLNIYYSGSNNISYVIGAGNTLELWKNNASQLLLSAQEKHNGTLLDTVDCVFKTTFEGLEIYTKYVDIWEADE